MTVSLDPHAKPPESVRALYKKYQKATLEFVLNQPDLIQIGPEGKEDSSVKLSQDIQLPADLREICLTFLGRTSVDESFPRDEPMHSIHEVPTVPGLYIYPSLLSSELQIGILNRTLHRDLSSPSHNTNVHLFHHVPYPPPDSLGQQASFFDPAAANAIYEPLDPAVHKPFHNQQFLNKKLRWVTLGGQYDWTNKVYPANPPPAFPSDLKQLIERIFPMKAEAAIVNLYSPGDTLSLHRDVSEECDQPLVSISIGCDAVFIVGVEGHDPAAILLRSGDAVLMSGSSRYAWHGVPKVLGETCPESIDDWPANNHTSQYEQWRGWMAGKRINLNVRQMFT